MAMSLLEIFNLFLDDNFFQEIVVEINNYYARKQCELVDAARERDSVATGVAQAAADIGLPPQSLWKETTLSEIKVCSIIMEIRGYSSADDIWSTDPILNDPYLSAIMSRDRYRALSLYFHIVDNNTVVLDRRSANYDPIHEIRPVINFVNDKFAAVYKPKQICVDEAMLKFKGRHRAKKYISSTPIKWGFKVCGFVQRLLVGTL